MSHVATIETEFKDLEALKLAFGELGFKFLENKKTYEWYGKWMNDYSAEQAAYKHGVKPEDYGKCDHAAQLEGVRYEIGVLKVKETGAFRVVWDNWAGGGGNRLDAKLGEKGELLQQRYSLLKCEDLAKKRGLKTVREQHPDRIRLRAWR